MNQPTPPTVPDGATRHAITATGNGVQATTEWASLHSVEITNSAKDGPRISSVKCYGQSGGEAADQAIATYLYAEAKLRDALTANQSPIGGHTTKHPAQDGAA